MDENHDFCLIFKILRTNSEAMKFEVSSAELLKKLQVAHGAVSSNPVLPILEDFLFDIKKNNLTIRSTNLESTIISKISVLADSNFSVAIPATILLNTIKSLPDHPITISVDEDTFGVTIISKFGEYKLSGDKPEDFPKLPERDNVNEFEIDADSLNNALSHTLFATSNDELRIAMTGVLMQIDYNKIIFVATDAHKLVKFSIGGINSEESSMIIVPKKGLQLLRNALPANNKATISYNQKNIFIDYEDTSYVIRLIDAKYPDYNAVIPVDNNNVLSINRGDFLSSLKRIAIYANKTTNQVVLNLGSDNLNISAKDLDFSNEANEDIHCEYSGESMQIGFNAKFLIEMLGVLQADSIKIEMSNPNKAGIILPAEQEENENLLMLIMPVMRGH